MRNIFALIFVTSGLVAVTYSLRVEDVLPNLHRCNCESYEEDCLIKAIQSMRTHLAAGVKELGIPTFMPYSPHKNHYKLFLSDRRNSLLLKNIELIGLDYFYISKLKVLRHLPNMDIVIHFPRIILKADAYRNVSTLTSSLKSKYYNEINYVFRDTTIYANVTGDNSPSFASGNLPHFYLGNIHMTWKITEVEDHIDYFKLDKYTTALSTRSYYNEKSYQPTKELYEESINLPHRPVQDEVLDDLSYFIRKDLKTMLDKLPLEILCLS